MFCVWENLPRDILFLIFEYLPWQTRMWLTKQNYLFFHTQFEHIMPIRRQENLIRQMIRQDFSFVMSVWDKGNRSLWQKRKKYKYQNKSFCDYFDFLRHLCIQHQASNCRKVIS
jgi:hypothetical protein